MTEVDASRSTSHDARVRALRYLALGLAIVVGAIVLVLALVYFAQPTSYAITRTRTIAAPPEVVHAHLDDLRAYVAWDPWRSEPGTTPTTTFSPVASGVGAWVDRRDARGGGVRITITAIEADRVALRDETSGAFQGLSTQTFALARAAGGTQVSWTLAGDLHGLARLLWPVVRLEDHAGPEMDAALARLDHACTR
jgi:hypothetical protein